jgi:heme exporter protein C
MLAVTWATYNVLGDLGDFQDPASARIIIWHVPMAMLGMIWFWVAAAYSVGYLYGKRPGDTVRDFKILHSNEIGLVCTILATVTGSVFAYRQWQTPWNWDPKQVTITVLILMYLAYFVLRAQISDPALRGRISAVYSLIGAVSSVALMYIIPNLAIIQSLHPPGTTVTGGLAPNWKAVYWSATAGFLGITIWMFQLRLRVSQIELRLADGARKQAAQNEPRMEAVRKPRLGPAAGE